MRIAPGAGMTSSITEGRTEADFVLVSLDNKSALLFSERGTCLISNLENPTKFSLTKARYFCINGSFAWESPLIWDTTNCESEHSVTVVAPNSLATLIPARHASYSLIV